MTEYSVEKFYGEYALKKEDIIIAVLDSGTNARKVCDLLNWQDERIKSLEQANDEEYLTIQTSAQTLLTHLNHEYHNKKQYNEKFNYEEFQRIREFLTALTILNLTELDKIRKEMEE